MKNLSIIFLAVSFILYFFIFQIKTLYADNATNYLNDFLEVSSFKKEIALKLANKEFDELDRIAAELRETEERMLSGEWKLDQFYIGLTEDYHNSSIASIKDLISILTEWKNKKSLSITPVTALVEANKNLAWAYRTNGYADTVTAHGKDGFVKHLEIAWEMAEHGETLSEKDPRLYANWVSVALGLGSSRDTLYELIEKSMETSPNYFRTFERVTTPLLPRWGGGKGEVEDFSEWATEATQESMGKTLYPRLAFKVKSYVQDESFKNFNFDWEKIKTGFEELQTQFPYSFRDLNSYAWFACYFNDKELAGELFREINDQWDEYSKEVWQNKIAFNKWQTWALSSDPIESPKDTPLHRAAQRGDYLMAARLLVTSNDINRQNANGQTPLHLAIMNHRLQIVKLLLNAQARIDIENNEGEQAIHYRARYGYTELIKAILAQGINVNTASKTEKYTPLHLAASGNQLNTVAYLLENSMIDLNAITQWNKTSLHFAAQEGFTEMVSLLLSKKGILINPFSTNWTTPLHLAIKNGHIEIVKLLLEHGSEVNIIDKYGDTPISLAIHGNNSEIIQLLEKAGAKNNLIKTTDDAIDSGRILNDEGLSLMRNKKYNEAFDKYLEAMKIYPQAYSMYYNASLILFHDRKQYQEAYTLLVKALNRNPVYPEANYLLGRTLQQLNRNDEALYFFKRYIDLDPNGDGAKELMLEFPQILDNTRHGT